MPFDHQQIRAFRREVRMTQDELARRLEVPQSTVARWESGRCAPNAYHIGEMCDLGRVEGISPDFFFPSFSRIEPYGASIEKGDV